jgi:hypothetical protein
MLDRGLQFLTSPLAGPSDGVGMLEPRKRLKRSMLKEVIFKVKMQIM